MTAPTPTRSRSLNNNWLTLARVPGVTFALAALLLPTVAAAGFAPFAATDDIATATPVLPDPTPDAALAETERAPTAPPSTPATTPVATAAPPVPAFTTGQQLSPEQVEWFRAHAEEQRTAGLLRGNAVYSSW